jgi:cellulose biosynthesis protein BcsQ
MKVVSFSIFKGGTGKTTSAVNTAAALVKKGKKVLLVDLDQQASAPTRSVDRHARGNEGAEGGRIGESSLGKSAQPIK